MIPSPVKQFAPSASGENEPHRERINDAKPLDILNATVSGTFASAVDPAALAKLLDEMKS